MIKKPHYLNFNTAKNKGFTLMEVLIAIFVLIIGAVAALAVIYQTIAYTALSVSRLTASYLAQEGMEIVRNIRDRNWLEGNEWNAGLSTGDYIADYKDSSLISFSETPLKIDDAGFYNYSDGNDTRFKRKIIIEERDNNKLEISVEVEWHQLPDALHKVEVQGYLYNWR